MSTAEHRIRIVGGFLLLAPLLAGQTALGANAAEGVPRAPAAARGVAPQPVAAPPAAGLSDDLGTIRKRLLDAILEPVPAATAQRLVAALRPDGSWPDVDYQDTLRSRWKTAGHLGNVALLGRAYRSPHSELRGKAELRAAALLSLDYWLDHDFRNSNWWWNEIGVPRSLGAIMLMLDDDLSPAQRQRGLEILSRAKIGMTGQNLVWVTEITAVRGILENDPALVATAYRRIAEEIRVGTGEGIQPDFSFHQHGPCLYSHGYGAAFAVDCSRIATQVAGTGLAFSPEKVEVLARLILDGSQWMTRGTATDFGAEGREITRQGQDARYLSTAAEQMLKLPTGREREFRGLAARAADRPAPPLEGNRHFWRSDMMVHHRPGYYASARMFSKRIANTDGPANSEGLKSHHIADGCNLIMRTGREYRDVFPVWDWQKIPGTTVEQQPELAGSPRRMGERGFVGGVSDGQFGLAAFDFVREKLAARKSWFFFDQEFVCLGAGITCPSDRPVVTTLNQCNLEGDVAAAAGGQVHKLDRGTHHLDQPAWVWHDQIAYVFLAPARVTLRNAEQRGSWHEINQQYPAEQLARPVFSLWIDHGAAPDSAAYAYVVAPGVEQSSVPARAAALHVRILRNEPPLQAVWHEKLKIAGMAFYQPGSVEIRPGLSVAVDAPCLVLLRELNDRLAVSVSNPENEQATINVELSAVLSGDHVRVLEGGKRSAIRFELPGGLEAGKSVRQVVSRSGS